MRKGGSIVRGELIGLFRQHTARSRKLAEHREEDEGTDRQASVFTRWKRLMDVMDR